MVNSAASPIFHVNVERAEIHETKIERFCNLVMEEKNTNSITVSLTRLIRVFKGALSGLRQLLAAKPFKNDEKRFLFHLKSSFRSQDV